MREVFCFKGDCYLDKKNVPVNVLKKMGASTFNDSDSEQYLPLKASTSSIKRKKRSAVTTRKNTSKKSSKKTSNKSPKKAQKKSQKKSQTKSPKKSPSKSPKKALKKKTKTTKKK